MEKYADHHPMARQAALDEPDFAEGFSIPTAEELESFRLQRIQSPHILKLAPDIYEWLLSQGPDWERRADAILRREMMSENGV
ncbi:MAG: hypothetical protein HDQ44_01275 [Desulfovibrio sp.]|nr:hypothetical protein [Desulfovibrio sp.]